MHFRRHSTLAILCAALWLALLSACSAPATPPERLLSLEATVAALAAENAAQATRIADQDSFISYLATRGPLPITPVPLGATSTPYRPVVGSVIAEDGRCCVGGQAGSTATINLQLNATGPEGEANEMRLAIANVPLDETEMASTAWQPFAENASLDVAVALNWVGYIVSAQFRDTAGHLSPVYYTEIAVEGSP